MNSLSFCHIFPYRWVPMVTSFHPEEKNHSLCLACSFLIGLAHTPIAFFFLNHKMLGPLGSFADLGRHCWQQPGSCGQWAGQMGASWEEPSLLHEASHPPAGLPGLSAWLLGRSTQSRFRLQPGTLFFQNILLAKTNHKRWPRFKWCRNSLCVLVGIHFKSHSKAYGSRERQRVGTMFIISFFLKGWKNKPQVHTGRE